jgi:hypothetical protein
MDRRTAQRAHCKPTRWQPTTQRRRRKEPDADVSKDTEVDGTQRQRVERHGGGRNPTPTCRKTWKRKEPNANVSKDAEAEGTQCQRVERHGGGRNPALTCRKTRRRKEPSANTSEDREVHGTQRRRVEGRGGGGNQTPRFQKTRRRRMDPTPTCLSTWRLRGPNSDVSTDTKDTKVRATQRQYVEGRKGARNPRPTQGATARTGDRSRATWSGFFIIITSFHASM